MQVSVLDMHRNYIQPTVYLNEKQQGCIIHTEGPILARWGIQSIKFFNIFIFQVYVAELDEYVEFQASVL